MTAKEVCNYLGISQATLYRRVKSGELKPLPTSSLLKKAKEFKFNASDIEKLKPKTVTE